MSDRQASSPVSGAVRDSIRPSIGLGVGFLIAKFLPSQSGGDLQESVTGVVVVVVSAILAWLGKKLRDDGVVAGGPV